jgi:hypothetical protein
MIVFFSPNQICLIQSFKDNNIKELKQELANLLEEDATYYKLRSLPLYTCRITGFKFVCSKCYDNVYNMLVQQWMFKDSAMTMRS